MRRLTFVLIGVLVSAVGIFAAPAGPALATIPPPRICHGETATGWLNGPGTLVGTSGDDVLVGSAGNDVIKGNGGNDTICGGAGDDMLISCERTI